MLNDFAIPSNDEQNDQDSYKELTKRFGVRIPRPLTLTPINKNPPARCGGDFFYGSNRPYIRGNGMVSLTWGNLQTHATNRSRPNPNPECGTEP